MDHSVVLIIVDVKPMRYLVTFSPPVREVHSHNNNEAVLQWQLFA